MESNTNSNDYESIARAICDQTNLEQSQFNLDMVLQVIDKIEDYTGCKLYNKDQLTNQLVEFPEENFSSEAKNAIFKNMIPQVDFNKLFKSDMEFTLVFKEDDVIVLYKNKVITVDDLEQIKLKLVRNNLTDFPKIYEMYVDNICNVIYKFITKDISVQYYCANIPTPYWKLFEIKAKKSNSTTKDIHEKCKELEKIITGQYFQPAKPDVQVIGQDANSNDDELKAVLMQIEEYENNNKNTASSNSTGPTATNQLTASELKALDDIYRMEVMSYLNDNEMMQFLIVLEKLDKMDTDAKYNEKEFITKYFKIVIESIKTMGNNIAQFYYVYRLYSLINNAVWFLEQHDTMKTTISNKINEYTEQLYILQSAELKLYQGVVSTMSKTKEHIDTINKKANPNYVPTWQTSDQQSILNQIISNAQNTQNTQTNNTNIQNGPNGLMIEEIDGSDDTESYHDEHDSEPDSDYESDN